MMMNAPVAGFFFFGKSNIQIKISINNININGIKQRPNDELNCVASIVTTNKTILSGFQYTHL